MSNRFFFSLSKLISWLYTFQSTYTYLRQVYASTHITYTRCDAKNTQVFTPRIHKHPPAKKNSATPSIHNGIRSHPVKRLGRLLLLSVASRHPAASRHLVLFFVSLPGNVFPLRVRCVEPWPSRRLLSSILHVCSESILRRLLIIASRGLRVAFFFSWLRFVQRGGGGIRVVKPVLHGGGGIRVAKPVVHHPPHRRFLQRVGSIRSASVKRG